MFSLFKKTQQLNSYSKNNWEKVQCVKFTSPTIKNNKKEAITHVALLNSKMNEL